jgi:hypothetical protein
VRQTGAALATMFQSNDTGWKDHELERDIAGLQNDEDENPTTTFTLRPIAAWQKIENGWICVYSRSREFRDVTLSTREFNRRFPVLARS